MLLGRWVGEPLSAARIWVVPSELGRHSPSLGLGRLNNGYSVAGWDRVKVPSLVRNAATEIRLPVPGHAWKCCQRVLSVSGLLVPPEGQTGIMWQAALLSRQCVARPRLTGREGAECPLSGNADSH